MPWRAAIVALALLAEAPRASASEPDPVGTTLLYGIHGNVLFSREERAAQVEEGVKLLKRAAAKLKGANARVLRREIASLLEGANRKADADEIRRRYGLGAE